MKTEHLLCVFPAKDVQPESNLEKTSDKLKLKTGLKNDWPGIFKSSKVKKEEAEERETVSDGRK